MSNRLTLKKIVGEIMEESIYWCHSSCPYCKSTNETEVEEDNITITESCYYCKKNYKVKIPKDSI